MTTFGPEKICIVGSGKVFNKRAPLVEALRASGPRVEVRATSIPDADQKTQLLTVGALPSFFDSATLSIVMLSALKSLSPAEEYLETMVLRHLVENKLTFGLSADDEMVFHEQMERLKHVRDIVKCISFMLIPKALFPNLRQSGFSMSFFGLDAAPQALAQAMLSYSRNFV